jgi:predicted TPR repeat methyltransferase
MRPIVAGGRAKLYDRKKPAAMSGNFEQARDFFVQGIAHYQAGRFPQAERDFAASLSLLPGRASTLTNLGATRLKLGKFQDAADLLQEALAQEPGNVEALGHRATALAELGEHAQALVCAERALAVDASLAVLWTLRGNLLKELRRFDQARESFEKAIALGADNELNRYFLAGLSGQPPPASPPRDYVEGLFDSYADDFEPHLLHVLNYRAPELLIEPLARDGRSFARALDLGCGTGLCGVLMRPLSGRLDAVDLSANMVARSVARNVYDSVQQADLVEYLRSAARRYELVVAADVFIYVGALEAVFAGVAQAMEKDGVFCFSVESTSDDMDYELRPSLRYAHSPGYIRKLSVQYGFEITRTSAHPIRDDQRSPVPGWFAWLNKL